MDVKSKTLLSTVVLLVSVTNECAQCERTDYSKYEKQDTRDRSQIPRRGRVMRNWLEHCGHIQEASALYSKT
jgi:alkylhydroperoxidase family enzyme